VAGCKTSILLRIAAPSLEMRTSPVGSCISLSIPRGPSDVRMAVATALEAMMLERRTSLPFVHSWRVSPVTEVIFFTFWFCGMKGRAGTPGIYEYVDAEMPSAVAAAVPIADPATEMFGPRSKYLLGAILGFVTTMKMSVRFNRAVRNSLFGEDWYRNSNGGRSRTACDFFFLCLFSRW